MPAKYLVTDIETIPSELSPLWDPSSAPPRPDGSAPMPPFWAHMIAVIGILVLDEHLQPLGPATIAQPRHDEALQIAQWSRKVQGGSRLVSGNIPPLVLVDFNGRSFDLPVLQARALYHGVPLPWYFGRLPDNRGDISQWSKQYRDRYQGWHLDLREWWGNYGAVREGTLDHYARLCGLPGKLGMDGSQVGAAWARGQYDEVESYCRADVYQTAIVFARMRLIAGRIQLANYRTAVGAIVSAAATDSTQAPWIVAIDERRLMLTENA